MSSSKSARRIGCAALAAMGLVVIVCGGGFSGVPIGSRTFRIVYPGGPPEGRAIVEQRWHTDAPWRGGLVSSSTFEVDDDASLEGNAVVARVARARWAFYGQRLQTVVVGVTRGGSARDVLHFESAADPNAQPDSCESAIAAGGVARLTIYGVHPPLCIAYPEDASEVEITVDGRGASSFFLECSGGPRRFTTDEPRLVPAGGTQVCHIRGGRLAGIGAELGEVTSRLEAAAVPEALWQELRGSDVEREMFTRQEWQALVARVGAEERNGWQLAIEHATLTVTGPAAPGADVRVVVIGFPTGDEIAMAMPELMTCATPEAYAAAMADAER